MSLADSLRAATAADLASRPPAAAVGSPGVPARRILEDLARHPELIPFAGVQGSTMRFHTAQSWVISPEWAYGYFEDGHIAGRGLFEFRMEPGGGIAWKRLAAQLD